MCLLPTMAVLGLHSQIRGEVIDRYPLQTLLKCWAEGNLAERSFEKIIFDLAAILSQTRIDINQLDQSGMTPLQVYLASCNTGDHKDGSHQLLLTELILLGADLTIPIQYPDIYLPEICESAGVTGLHLFASSDLARYREVSPELLRLLTSPELLPTWQTEDANKQTPLMYLLTTAPDYCINDLPPWLLALLEHIPMTEQLFQSLVLAAANRCTIQVDCLLSKYPTYCPPELPEHLLPQRYSCGTGMFLAEIRYKKSKKNLVISRRAWTQRQTLKGLCIQTIERERILISTSPSSQLAAPSTITHSSQETVPLKSPRKSHGCIIS